MPLGLPSPLPIPRMGRSVQFQDGCRTRARIREPTRNRTRMLSTP